MNNRHSVLAEWDLSQWQRMSPWSILYFIGSTLRNLLDPNLLVMLAPAYGIYQLVDNTLYFILLSAISVPGLIIGVAVFQYLFFRFRIRDNNFQIRRGLLFKRHMDLPVTRIQDVNIDKPFYFKPLNLVSATLDTAGSAENEAVLAAVSEPFANALKEWVISWEKEPSVTQKANEHEASPSASSLPENEHPVLRRSLQDLVIHGITNNKVWIILAAAFPFIDRFIQHQWNGLVANQASQFSSLVEADALYAYGLLVFLAAAIIIAMMILSVLGSIFLLYGYELRRNGGALSRESGLFSRNQINLKIRRVQHIHIKQSLPDRLFGRFNLIYRQLDNYRQADHQANNRFLVPSITAEDLFRLTAIAYPENSFRPGYNDAQLIPVSRRFILQQFLTKTLPVVLLVLALFVINDGDHYLPMVAMLSIGLGAGANLLQWRRLGYLITSDFLILRSGLIGKNYLIVPRYKTQQVTVSRSYPMEFNGHCNVSLVVGLTEIKVPYIPFSAATTLVDQCLYDVEATSRSWM